MENLEKLMNSSDSGVATSMKAEEEEEAENALNIVLSELFSQLSQTSSKRKQPEYAWTGSELILLLRGVFKYGEVRIKW